MATNAKQPIAIGQCDGPYAQIILFGDSITENSFDPANGFSEGNSWGMTAYKRRLDIINRGFSGYNTDHALAVLPKFIPTTAQAKVELLIICFGANDSCLENDPTGHHVPLDVYRDNIEAIITNARVQEHRPSILLVTPPPINEHQRIIADQARGFGIELRRTVRNTQQYAQACKDVGNQLHVPVVDIWTAFTKHAGWKEGDDIIGSHRLPANQRLQELFTDGLHLTSAGYTLLFSEVLQAIRANFPSLDPDKMPFCHSPWDVAAKIR